MTPNKLNRIIDERLKLKEEELRYHKRSRLLGVRESLLKMIEGNLSIREQIEVLSEVGIKVSDRAYRDFLAREFGDLYDAFLKRNGWVRKKRKKENYG
ncbi:MAG: hypothetical protein LBT81_02850 [Helicobacteraceae bacterium]|jgi:hypothetical protein|nr:hypothetical protein [Helicobacteraceae bacterium]